MKKNNWVMGAIGIILIVAISKMIAKFLIFGGLAVLLVSFVLGLIYLVKKRNSAAKKAFITLIFSLIVVVIGNVLAEPTASTSAASPVKTAATTSFSAVKDSSITATAATTEASHQTAAAKKKEPQKAVEKTAAAKKTATDAAKKTNLDLANSTYSGTQTIDVNNGVPVFTAAELSTAKGAWEVYGDLDALNRVTSAEALLNQRLMPTEKRGDISNVTPTGWKNKKIKGGYLYNRSHLIGFALAGENANWKNLMTGTRQLNSPEMLRFEMDIKTYLEQSSTHYVRYSVIPIFRDTELVARGVHLQAQSIGDDSIRFNVFIYNIQDGVTINYADGSSVIADSAIEEASAESADEPAAVPAAETAVPSASASASAAPSDTQSRTVYVAPDSGKKYHYDQGCRGLKSANSIVSLTEQEAIAQGYTLCGWED